MNKKQNIGASCKKAAYTIALPVLVYAIMCIARPNIYLSGSTFISLLLQSFIYMLMGWSMLFGMSCDLFDFSVGSRYLLAALFGIRMSQIFGVAGFILGILLSSLFLAAITGVFFAGLKIPSIIAGFVALLIFEGLACIYQKTFSVVVTSDISVFGRTPGIYILVVLCFILVYVLFNRTKFGYQIKAIGGNEAIARNMGIKAVQLKVMTYVVGGLILGLASIVKVGYDQSVVAATNMSSMTACFTPMMAVMIGLQLTSCNPIVGTAVGAFAIATVSSGVVTLGINYRLQNVVIGVFLLIFIAYKTNLNVLLDLRKRRLRTKVSTRTS